MVTNGFKSRIIKFRNAKLTGKKKREELLAEKEKSKSLYMISIQRCVWMYVCVSVWLKGMEKASKLLRDLMKSGEYVNDVS